MERKFCSKKLAEVTINLSNVLYQRAKIISRGFELLEKEWSAIKNAQITHLELKISDIFSLKIPIKNLFANHDDTSLVISAIIATINGYFNDQLFDNKGLDLNMTILDESKKICQK